MNRKECISKMKKNIIFRVIFILMISLLLIGSVYAEPVSLKLATTTSTVDSGLLDKLLPPFEEFVYIKSGKLYNIRVDVISVGSGKAITLGQNGDVDILFTHDPAAEAKFVQDGYGVNRRDVMYNDFIILGPTSDPAKIKGMKDVVSAFTKIANQKAFFVSRADKSGTDVKEKGIWATAGITPDSEWYIEAGLVMGATLQMADEKQAYVLTDRGTFLNYKGKIGLSIVCEGDPLLFNPYTIIALNPERFSHVKYIEAMQLIAWVTSVEGQKIIREYQIGGEVLFHPVAIK
jgi:tungstate transport system substrate-binding protein